MESQRTLRKLINEASSGKNKYVLFQQVDLTWKHRELVEAKRVVRAGAKVKNSQQRAQILQCYFCSFTRIRGTIGKYVVWYRNFLIGC